MATAGEQGEQGSPSVILRGKSGRRISHHLSFRDSTVSIRVDRSEIDAILSRKWSFQEVQHLLSSQLAVLPGGRDRQGGAVIIIALQGDTECNPPDIGKIMTYLSNIPEMATRQCGYTIIVDGRKGSWHTAKSAIKSLQHTFADSITQLLLLKPNKFWERRRAGMGMSLHRSRYTFSIVLLDNCRELLHYLGASQLPMELDGSLTYNHEEWMAAQEVLERAEAELLALLTEYEQLQEIMEHYDLPGNLAMAKDSLRLHNEHDQLIKESRLSKLCQRCQEEIKRLRQPALHPHAFSPSKHPDIRDCMLRLEAHMGSLYANCGLLTTLWRQKNRQLQECLQLRQLEFEYDSHVDWLDQEGKQFLRTHMDIGDCYEAAMSCLQQWQEFHSDVNLVGQNICATIVMGEELQQANHYAAEQIRDITGDLSSQWENFCRLLQERVGLLEHSVNFHEKLQSFLRQLKEWLDRCGSQELSNSVEESEQFISSHEELKEAYQSMYKLAIKDGQQLREGLMYHMGVAKGNTPSHSNLSVHLHRVQATIDDVTENYHHLDSEWMRRSHELHCQLNLCSFRRESEQVLLWVQQEGNLFLSETNSIGTNAAEATEILGQFDEFEANAAEVYNTCTQLLTWAEQMEENGSCFPELIHQESQKLENSVQQFVSQLDQCRETVMVAIDFHTLSEKLWRGWVGLKQQLDAEQFADSVDNCNDQLHQLKQRWHGDSQATNQVFTKAAELVARLQSNMGVDYQQARQQMEDHVMRLQDQQQNVERTWRWRQSCLEAWLAMHQFAIDVAMHLDRSSSWMEQMMLTNVEAIESFVDAQMKCDSFTRQLSQISTAHNNLVTKSKEVIDQLEQYSCLDTVVYSHTSAKDHVRQLVMELEALLLEVHTQGEMIKKRLQDCLQFYRFYQQVEECSISISQCGSSVDPISAVGSSQAAAERLLELTKRMCDQMKTILEALSTYEGQLKEYVEKQHFRYSKMQAIFTATQAKWAETNDHLDVKLHLLESTIRFYANVKKVDAKLDTAQRIFASKESPVDVKTCEQLLHSHEQLLDEVKRECKNLKTEGNALCDRLSPWVQLKPLSPASSNVSAYCSPVLRQDGSRFRRSLDHLDVANGKEETSVDQINQALMGVEVREAHCKEMFSLREQHLKHVARKIKFEISVREMLEWVKDTGSSHVEVTSPTATERKAEDVLEEHRMFMENDATVKNGVVHHIREEARNIMNDDHGNGPQIKLLLGELDAVWGRFERNLSTKEEQLKVAVEFQEMMSEADNWCSATKKLLSDMEERMSSCDSSHEVQTIIKELNLYTTSTKLEHNTRIMRVKELASRLKWNDLNNLVYQMEAETNAYIQRMITLKEQLQEQATKIELIEQEKDKKQRKLKQKERVLNELVSTEKLYVADLKMVKDTYLLHYTNITMTDSVMNKQGVVFVNLESIEKYHSQTFLPLLEKAVGLGLNSVAELFLGQAEKLATLYVSYCQGKTASEQLIVANLSFFNELQHYVKLDLPLSSYLIKPVQRITKYPLLLKEALRYCTQLEEEIGFDALNLACKQLENIVTRTNNAVHLSLIDGFDESLVEFGNLLYQGSLVLSERTWRAHDKERQLFLFEMGILLCRRQELSLGKIKYVFKQKVMASDIQSVEVLDDPCKFVLVVKGDQKFLFKTSTSEEREAWVDTITSVIYNLEKVKQRDTLGRASMRSSFRRNAVTITRSSSLSPTPVAINNGVNTPHDSPQNSPLNSPIHFLDPPTLMKSDSLPLNFTHKRNPVVAKKLHVPSRESPTRELENNTDAVSLQRTASSLSTNSYSSINSTTSQAQATGSPTTIPRSKSFSKPNNQDETTGSQRYLVLKDFEPSTSRRNSMKLQRDQSIEIIHKGEIDWWYGRTSDGQVGWIPKDVVEAPESQSSHKGGSRRHMAIRRRRGSNYGGGGMKSATSNSSISSLVSLEDEDEKRKVGTEKMSYVLQELVDTEKEYVDKMSDVIKEYLPEMLSGDLPEPLVYKDRIIFGNIEDLHGFHSKTFFPALKAHDLKSPDVHEAIAKCFIDNSSEFEMYVKYCENKPRSEALLATPAGSHFDGLQFQLGQKEDISSLLIRPVQRITKYQLLLGQLLRYAEKYGLPYTQLEKAVELMTEVPKRANDMMKLSMIDEYPSNIHANGSLLMCDDFTLCERNHKHGVSRRVFLLESKMVITKLMDNGHCLYRDALNLHNLTLTESLTDNPSRFAVASGTSGNWDRYYILEAPSTEIKEEWMECIKKILLKDLEMMKALVTGGAADKINIGKKPQAILLSDSDDEECQHYQPPTSKLVDVGKEASPTPNNNELYIVTEDCAPPTEGEGIFYMRCGQVYEVTSKISDWWQARLVLDMINPDLVGKEGWVAPSFLDRFTGSLEEQKRLMAQQRMRTASTSTFSDTEHSLSKGMKKAKHRRGMLSFKNKEAPPAVTSISNGNRIFSEELSDVTCMVGGAARLRCSLAVDSPNVKVEWLHNGNPITHKRAFVHEGQTCIFQIKPVELSDAGNYSCHVTVDKGTTVVSSAKLKVILTPGTPSQPIFVQSAPSLVSLRWDKPADDGGTQITGYIVTGCDRSDKDPHSVTQWVPQCGGIIRDLQIGHTYIFSVKAINKVGEGPSSEMSQSVQIPYGTVKKFTTQREYSTGTIVGSGRFSEVRTILQSGCKLAGKMIKTSMGLSVAQQELDMLMMVSHDNIVALEDAYKTSKHFVIVMQMVEGCSLFNYVVEQDCLTEGVAVDCLHQLLSALCYLHTHYIAHLDIKPENIMATDRGVVPHITLIDFGSAKFTPIGGEVMMDIPAGSIDFVAPEILNNKPVSVATDMWAFGVFTYILLSGISPFNEASRMATMKDILAAKYHFPSKQFNGLSSNAKSFISRLLLADMQSRLTCSEAIQTPWIQGEITRKSAKSQARLDITSLKQFASKRAFQGSRSSIKDRRNPSKPQ